MRAERPTKGLHPHHYTRVPQFGQRDEQDRNPPRFGLTNGIGLCIAASGSPHMATHYTTRVDRGAETQYAMARDEEPAWPVGSWIRTMFTLVAHHC